MTIEWWGILIIILATVLVYTLVLYVGAKFISGKLKGDYLFTGIFTPFDTADRIHTIAKHYGVEPSKVKYVGDSKYFVQELDKTVQVSSFIGVGIYEERDGTNHLVNNEQELQNAKVIKQIRELEYERELSSKYGDEA